MTATIEAPSTTPGTPTDFLNLPPLDLTALTLTAADLDSMTDEQIAERLNQIQAAAIALRKHAKAITRERKAIETVGHTVGALQTASNDLVRAQFNHGKITDRLARAQKRYADVQAAYLRANNIEALPEEVVTQLDSGRDALLARLSGPVARVKKSKPTENGAAPSDESDEE